MCILAYVIQREAVVARALADVALAPHAKDPDSIPTPESAVGAFDDWLDERPEVLDRPLHEVQLHDLLFPGKR